MPKGPYDKNVTPATDRHDIFCNYFKIVILVKHYGFIFCKKSTSTIRKSTLSLEDGIMSKPFAFPPDSSAVSESSFPLKKITCHNSILHNTHKHWKIIN